MKGYMNKVLHFQLSESSSDTRPINTEDLQNYVGGSGLSTKILFDETDKNTDPLGPENILIFMTGPFTLTKALCSSRYTVVAKSPLTGIYGEASSGGSWAATLKASGFDGIVFRGKAEKPVYLWINNGRFELRDASHIWGKDTFETDTILKSETDTKAVVCCIGPAGENKVPFAAILNDGTHARTAARCGLGAVMGSKNLKAIVVKGNQKSLINDLENLKISVKNQYKKVKDGAFGLTILGTPGAVAPNEEFGSLPVKNWQHTGRWEEGAQKVTGGTFLKEYGTGNYFCKSCIIGCGKNIKVPKGRFKREEQAAPEYETLGLMGSNCLIDDPEVIFEANDLCNRYGLDTMSTAGVISFGMEAFEKGLISLDDTEGIDLVWGNGNALLKVIKKISDREGIGKLLSLGTKEAARILGRDSEEFAIHVKGLELPAHDPRVYSAGAVNLATSSRGACHLSGCSHQFERGMSAPEIGIPFPLDPLETKGKGIITAKTQDYMGMLDSLTGCKFLPVGKVGISDLVEWYKHITGEHMDITEFMKCGEKIFNLKRLYNVKCGISRKDDTYPQRMLIRKKVNEENVPIPLPLEEMLDEYYMFRGWSENGIPTMRKLEELGIPTEG